MAVVVPHTQEITLAWTSVPTVDSMKRAAKDRPAETKDLKKRPRKATREIPHVKPEPLSDDEHEAAHASKLKREASEGSHSEDHSPTDDGNDDYKWPALARKRQRMTEDERKARHREVQRQFMQRKLAKLDEMRKLVLVLEKQFLLLQLSQDRARLEHEHDYLHRRVLANASHWTHEHPHETQRRLSSMHLPRHPPPSPPLHHTSSHAHHSNLPHHRPPTGMLPWDEILEAVSEANV